MYSLWMVWRYLKSRHEFFSLTSILSILGMAIAVACMVVSMAVVSGYETTLRRSVIDVVGHLIVIKRGTSNTTAEELVNAVKPSIPGFHAATPFVLMDAVIAHKKRLTGVLVQGVEASSVEQVLRLEGRLHKGKIDFLPGEEIPGVLVGKGLAEKYQLSLGDVLQLVMPQPSKYDAESFRPKVKKFRLTGVLNFGRHDFDSRYVTIDLKSAQEFAGLGQRITGIRIRVGEDEQALSASYLISKNLGYPYWTRSWMDVNHNLFEAARIEKRVIFFVLLILVVAACFNIVSTLFVSVLRRYGDIGILKAMGARRRLIIQLFSIEGLMIGTIGALFGLLLGLVACYGFLFMQDQFGLISGEIYKLDRLEVDLRWTDLLAIFFASLLVCFISTLAPAIRGSRLEPTEGLRYE